MSNFDWEKAFYLSVLDTPLSQQIPELSRIIQDWKSKLHHADQKRWEQQLQKLPEVRVEDLEFGNKVSFGSVSSISANEAKQLRSVLKGYMPWRKGPFNLFGVEIDTEWRSDFKWDRIKDGLPDLTEKRVLDVGCGSGYHLFRMHQSGASQVIGIDPTVLFFYQFLIFKKYIPDINIHYLPFPLEQIPVTEYFDIVFSMGVLYHRQDPLGFLKELKSQLRKDGQLVLETLIFEGNANEVLMPSARYAQMRNVYFIPSAEMLHRWLQRVGFKDIKIIEQNYTTIDEQRSTEWMEGHSLREFLDPDNAKLTVEGYQAPLRATFIATK